MKAEQKLIYIHDPMCSWCWGFAPNWQRIRQTLPESFVVEYVLGGLAPDSLEPMPENMRAKLQSVWRQIQETIPGTRFNFEFWTQCKPRRSTYSSCRAVLAAKTQGEEFEQAMISAIQKAYYLEARNPSDIATLNELAVEIGLDVDGFEQAMTSSQIEQQLQDNIQRYLQLPAQGFPSLVLQTGQTMQPIQIDYNHPEHILRKIGVG